MARKRQIIEPLENCHANCIHCTPVKGFIDYKGDYLIGECEHSECGFLLCEKTDCKHYAAKK